MLSIKDKVRFGETDMMGLVYHPNYLHWMEMGRIAYLAHCGVTLNALMEEGILFPIRDISAVYKNSMTYGDEYEVQTAMQEFSKIKMTFKYKIIRLRDSAVAVEGSTCNVFTDASGKVKRLPEKWFNKINEVYLGEKEEICNE